MKFRNLLCIAVVVSLAVTSMVVAQRDTAVNMSEALEKAKDALQLDGWTLESSERDENEFEFEFVMNETDSEAEVTVSVRSGNIITVREETDIDDDTDEYVREDERIDEDSDDDVVDDTDNVTSLEEARKRIAALEARIERLQRELQRLRAAEERDSPSQSQGLDRNLPERADDRAREARDEARDRIRGVKNETEVDVNVREDETEVEVEANESEVEVERRGPREGEGPDGVPGEDSNRPGFVTRMLQAIFG